MEEDSKIKIKISVFRYTFLILIVWTSFIVISILFNAKKQSDNTVNIVKNVANESFNKDLASRLWATSHGGVYVTPTQKTPPSPWMAHLKNRDLVTVDGKKLTLMNPAYMLREMMDDYSKLYGIRGRIVGIKYLNPNNKADVWEENTIRKFENGVEEVIELTGQDKEERLKLMKPMMMKEGCQKCHGHLGYPNGSVRGGISVSVPMSPYRDIEFQNVQSIIFSHIIVWLIGSIAILFGSRKIKQQLLWREDDIDEIKISSMVFDNTIDAVLITDINGKIVRVNSAFSKLTGYDTAELLGSNPRILKSEYHNKDFYKDLWKSILNEGFWKGEIWNRKKDGQVFIAKESISTVKSNNGTVKYIIAIMHDITQQKNYESEIKNLAHYDLLTGLPNRALFYDRFEQSIERNKRNDEKMALLFIDLDGFKTVNDTKGHPVGDKLITQVGHRLKNIFRQSDTVARIGGDEFTIIIENYSNINDLLTSVNKVLSEVSKEIIIEDHNIFISASIGISTYPQDGKDVDTLIKHSDTAMYKAKEKGKNQYSFYEIKMTQEAEEKSLLEMQIKNAIKNSEFVVYYQPKVNVNSGKIEYMEALVRWNNKELGIIPPDKFIPLAEELNIIDKIDMYVLKQACLDTKKLIENGHNLKVAVNFSGYNITKNNCLGEIVRILKETNFEATNLELEITETYFINFDEKCLNTMNKIRDLGIGLTIDDFGTGYSSLNILKTLPVEVLKIDKSFISTLEDNTSDYLMVKSIIEMAHSLDLEVVAEGVEKIYQYNFLQEHKCDIIQGYYISRPVCFEEFEKKLIEYNSED